MDKKHRERGDNWTTEEKEIFMELMKESTVVIEDKRTDTNSNKRKVAEWQKVQNKLQELTGKHRDVSQMKGFWRRIKMAAKKSVSDHRRALRGTGGGPRPPTPTEEVQIIMEMCPTDFIEEKNEFDCDSIFEKVDVDVGGASFIIEDVVIDDINSSNNEIITKRTALGCISQKENNDNHIPAKRLKTPQQNHKTVTKNAKRHKPGASHKNLILENNIELKEKQFKLLEEDML